jgi:hypothetical protein
MLCVGCSLVKMSGNSTELAVLQSHGLFSYKNIVLILYS